jgi:hypothetical protein
MANAALALVVLRARLPEELLGALGAFLYHSRQQEFLRAFGPLPARPRENAFFKRLFMFTSCYYPTWELEPRYLERVIGKQGICIKCKGKWHTLMGRIGLAEGELTDTFGQWHFKVAPREALELIRLRVL